MVDPIVINYKFTTNMSSYIQAHIQYPVDYTYNTWKIQYSHENYINLLLILPLRCRLVAYYVAKDGEIVADALEFEVAGTLTNFVEIFTSR